MNNDRFGYSSMNGKARAYVDATFDDTCFSYTKPSYKRNPPKPVTKAQLELITRLIAEIGKNDEIVTLLKEEFNVDNFSCLNKNDAFEAIKLLIERKRRKYYAHG